MRCQVALLCAGLAIAAGGCAKVKAAVCVDMVPAPKPGAAADAAKPAGKLDKPAETPAPADQPEGEPEADPAQEAVLAAASAPQEQFALPFAWEKSPSEPLSRTRAFLRELARDNGAYMRRGPDYFKPFANAEAPRVTLLSCADSRVQPSALDANPENDLFTVRNLGNQVVNGLGGIQYGIDELKTPLLFVLGHTGCGAVKAAMSGTAGLSEPIKRELAPLRVGKRKGKHAVDEKGWRDGVVRNVNDQVEAALKAFSGRVNAGQLTVIGAVYDLRNDLGKGPGKVSIINVNGVTEAKRLKAFEDAVLAGANLSASSSTKIVDPFERLAKVFTEHMNDEDEVDEEEEEAAQPAPLAPIHSTTGPMFSDMPTVAAPAPAPAPAAHH